jgi:signal transduction histidine kinase/CheY-like chemotaxis protein
VSSIGFDNCEACTIAKRRAKVNINFFRAVSARAMDVRMILHRVERIWARAIASARRYKKYDLRKFTIASAGVAAFYLTLAYFPLELPQNWYLTLAPAVLLLAAISLGVLSLLVSTTCIVIGQMILQSPAFDSWSAAASALVASALLGTRAHPALAMLAYGAVNISCLLLASDDSSAIFLSLARWQSLVVDAFLNFNVAIAIWTLLPRRFGVVVRLRRRSLATQLFSWSMVVALVPAIAVLKSSSIAAPGAGGGSNTVVYGMLAAAIIATGVCAWFTVRITAVVRYGFDALVASEGTLKRRTQPSRFGDAPWELARQALRILRRLRLLRRDVTAKGNQLAELRREVEQRRKEVADLGDRLQANKQTLLLVQRRDTTNMKDLEEALREANATIEQIRRGRNLFVAMMSHEVRTPLHGLMATLSLLREETLSDEGRRRLDIARSSAKSLLSIANDILDLSRVETGGFSFEVKPFDPRRLVGLIVEEFQATAQAQRLKLVSTIDDNLPQALMGDRNRIHQVISNLVTNALKFTEKGGVTIRVAWREEKLIVDVIDTGGGVPPEKREAIFDSFVQAESAPNRRSAGTGLGLTIGRHLAKAMGGSLNLHVSSKNGSIFRLELKLEVSDEPVPEDTSQRILAHPTGHILVVEDNEANQYVAKVLLESLDCTVAIVDNGKKALERVQQEQFDLVLMDCQLPGMDGYETAQRMREVMVKRIPIIAMTANALPEGQERCAAVGMDAFLTKPFSKATLSRLLGEWLAEDSKAERTEPVLDMEVFDELWESLQWRTKPLEGIYEAVVNNVRGAIHLLSQPQPAASQQLLRSLHTVRGSASMVGAKRLARIAAMLEHSARNQQLNSETIETASLAHELRELETAVTRKLAPYVGRQS